ncbi:rust resistance kinase Lr10-like isoform X2 [Gastrolobium bilobum]|uniref:rust resistance kinase Lr10-like isoform X2 n=1 Tax=Gastrolobium bilobum TaxID=150636 RepID=UPI002AB13121|nr:rust resistance kinase Lr10-like isoform X2 [Gastrolobium bilobum]
MITYSHFLVVMLLIQVSNMGMCEINACRGDLRCGRHGPEIRFPFRIKDSEADECSHSSGFDLTCSDKRETLLELPPIKLKVRSIDYTQQLLYVSDPENCLPKQLLKLYQSSISPFHQFETFGGMTDNITFLNCDSVNADYLQVTFSCPIYAADSTDKLLGSDLFSCTKMYDVSSNIDPYELQANKLGLTWSKPDCSKCETQGKMCTLKNNGTRDDIECFDRYHKPIKKIVLDATAVFVGSILVMLIFIACLRVYCYFKAKGEDQARIEKFLEDYRALNPARFSYAAIKRITNNFRDKLGEGAHGAVFKGKLSNEILVAVKMLNNTEGDGKEFINEVEAMGKIHHINVVRLLGFCADGFYRALVYNFFPNGSLQNFIIPFNNIDKDRFLDWEKLQQIALGIAKGIDYLHQGCDHRILHFDINPHNVLLDDKFVPKISDFGLAKLCSKNQSIVSVTAARGTLGYIAPEVFSRNFGNVSYKSDIYSYGMLLLEMVGGRQNIGKSSDETLQVLYPEWIHNLLEGRDILVEIEGAKDLKIVKKLAFVGLWCIQWHPMNRPSVKTVMQMLEGDRDNLSMPTNPFASADPVIMNIRQLHKD